MGRPDICESCVGISVLDLIYIKRMYDEHNQKNVSFFERTYTSLPGLLSLTANNVIKTFIG